jgi:hypothetical protein
MFAVTIRPRTDPFSNDEIEEWLYRSGLIASSVTALRPDFPRWRRQLLARGVSRIPLSLRSADGGEALATNMLSLLVRQASDERNPAIEHNLRNLVGARPFKG